MQTVPPVHFCEALKLGFQNYAKFSGRTRRSEFFYFLILVYLIIFFSFIIFTIPLTSEDGNIDDQDNSDVLYLFIPMIFIFATIIPQISITVRRLHDTGRSGIYYFLIFLPFVGPILLLYFCCIDSEEGQNEYGPSPKYIMPVSAPGNNYNPPIAPVVVVQPTPVVVPVVAYTDPMAPQVVPPYPQAGPMPPQPMPYPGPNQIPPQTAPYSQANPIQPPSVAPYPPVQDPYSKPNPIQPQVDPYYNSSDFTGQ